MGHSRVNDRNVALALNIDAGRVSPQFHVKLGRRFHTVIQNPIESKWQHQAGFADPPSKTKQQNTQQMRKGGRLSKLTTVSEGAEP